MSQSVSKPSNAPSQTPPLRYLTSHAASDVGGMPTNTQSQNDSPTHIRSQSAHASLQTNKTRSKVAAPSRGGPETDGKNRSRSNDPSLPSHKNSKHAMYVDDKPDQVLGMMHESGGLQYSMNSLPAHFVTGGPTVPGGNHSQQATSMQYLNDWDEREELKQRELDEARARVAQMEKTMRWWSDCTTNWREKWSKVRNERNKSREEVRQLRTRLEVMVKDTTILKREKNELLGENDQLKRQIQELQGTSSDSTIVSEDLGVSEITVGQDLSETEVPEHDNHLSGTRPTENQASLEFLDKILHHNDGDKLDRKSKYVDVPDDKMAGRKAALIEMRLDEAQKTIHAEREDKNLMVKTIEKLQSDLSSLKAKNEGLKKSKQDALHQVSKIKDEHLDHVNRIALELEDESSSRYSMDQNISDLRLELERLQSENATEWGKRERLETEKLATERENKKLRAQIGDLEEDLDNKKKDSMATVDHDIKSMQEKLYDATKELNDLKHGYNKLKKSSQDRSTELEHAKRRIEQYELEVKRMRARIEELKRDLAAAEDEVDTQTNVVRKVQRTNDELQETMDSQQVQLDHLQTRLKRVNQQPLDLLRKGHRKSLGAEDSTDGFDSDEVD